MLPVMSPFFQPPMYVDTINQVIQVLSITDTLIQERALSTFLKETTVRGINTTPPVFQKIYEACNHSNNDTTIF